MPTLTKLVAWQPSAEVKFDGQDVWPLLSGTSATLASRPIYIPMPGRRAVLLDGWKLIETDARRDAKAKVELFHLDGDPSETTDLAGREPQRVEQLQGVLAELRREDLTTLPADLRNTDDSVGSGTPPPAKP